MESSSNDEFVDGLEYEPEESSATADTAEPTAQNNPTEKHSKWRKGLESAGKVVKQCFKTFTKKVCSGVKHSHTSRREPAAATDSLEPTRDDAQPSTSASSPSSQEDLPKKSIPWCNDLRLDGQCPVVKYRDTAVLKKLQKAPASKHLIRINGYYVIDHCEVLIMENLSATFITLREFIRRKGSSMKEKDARIIMKQIFEALNHCWQHGIYLPIGLDGIAINPKTLQVKITDYRRVLAEPSGKMTGSVAEAWLKERTKLQHAETYCKVMDALVKNIDQPHWKRRLSKECSDLLWRLKTHQGLWLLKTLQNILNDPWFKLNQSMIPDSGLSEAGVPKVILRKKFKKFR